MADASGQSDLESGLERIREVNERILEEARTLGVQYLDAYEQSLNSFADVQHRMAEASGQAWLTDLAKAQSDFIRTMSEAYLTGARELLSKS
jgi:Phasin protein